MVSRILVLFLGGYWFISAGVAAWIGRQKGRMIEGLGLGILMGPIGPILVAMLPDLRKISVHEAHHVKHEAESGAHPAGRHEEGHAEHVAAEGEEYATAREHAPHEGDWHETRGERAPSHADRFERWEDEEWDEGSGGVGKRLKIDWLWLIFYGGWSVFVVFCWLWLLMYS